MSGKSKIKICGLRRMEDIRAVNHAKPDFAGFIVEFPKSFRSVTKEELKSFTKTLDPEILPVGVFVNASIELVAGLLNDQTIAIAQLHGSEDEAYIKALRKLTDKPLIKAFSIRTKEDIEEAVRSSADYILLDQGSGGTGKTFDWSLIKGVKRDFFLAGGLNAANIKEAVEKFSPFAVDLSSGVESDRLKDPKKIEKAVSLVRESSLL